MQHRVFCIRSKASGNSGYTVSLPVGAQRGQLRLRKCRRSPAVGEGLDQVGKREQAHTSGPCPTRPPCTAEVAPWPPPRGPAPQHRHRLGAGAADQVDRPRTAVPAVIVVDDRRPAGELASDDQAAPRHGPWLPAVEGPGHGAWRWCSASATAVEATSGMPLYAGPNSMSYSMPERCSAAVSTGRAPRAPRRRRTARR